MRVLFLASISLLTIYIISSMEYKTFKDVVDGLFKKAGGFIEASKKMIGETINDIEGIDIDVIKINIDMLIDELAKKTDYILSLKTFNEKVSFIEREILEISKNMLKKIESDK